MLLCARCLPVIGLSGQVADKSKRVSLNNGFSTPPIQPPWLSSLLRDQDEDVFDVSASLDRGSSAALPHLNASVGKWDKPMYYEDNFKGSMILQDRVGEPSQSNPELAKDHSSSGDGQDRATPSPQKNARPAGGKKGKTKRYQSNLSFHLANKPRCLWWR